MWLPVVNQCATISEVFGPFDNGIPYDLLLEFSMALDEAWGQANDSPAVDAGLDGRAGSRASGMRLGLTPPVWMRGPRMSGSTFGQGGG